jgi:predicted ABC-type ATPase
VRTGGHGIPEGTVRRRYFAGLKNLHEIYLPVVDRWEVYDNTSFVGYRLIAQGGDGMAVEVFDPSIWATILEARHDE